MDMRPLQYRHHQNSKSMLALDQILTETMREAANEASLADGVLVSGHITNDHKEKKLELRRGKWTPEEEAYANRLIEEFKNGMLPIADGTTLRTFLSKLLHCDPMRISKKYVGNNCIGKQVYRQRHHELDEIPPEVIERSKRELEELERQFLDRSKQTSSRNRTTKSDTSTSTTTMKASRQKRDDYQPHHPSINHLNQHHLPSNSSSTGTSNGVPLAPWIIPPANPYTFGNETTSNPYARSTLEPSIVDGPKHNGFGFVERPSEIDLYNFPDAFPSSSSLDLLGSVALKLPSTRSFENFDKHEMESGGPSTTSLSEWSNFLADSAKSNSMADFQSVSQYSPKNTENIQNRLMPWDLSGSKDGFVKSSTNQNPYSTTTRSSPHNNNNSNNNNNGNNSNMKHSLSRELLQAAAAASALMDNDKNELDKILKYQQAEKLKQESLNTSCDSFSRIPQNSTPTTPSMASIPEGSDPRRTSSIDNFMMLVEMGDIPRPESSVLLKNIFQEKINSSQQQQQQQLESQSSSSLVLNKRTRPTNSLDILTNTDDQEDKHKRQRQDHNNSFNNENGEEEENVDDSAVDAHYFSAAVVRKPFTS